MTARLSLALFAVVLVGCPAPEEPDEPVVDPDPIDILGDWVDEWDTAYTIDDEVWAQGDYTFWLTQWSADAGWAVAQNDDANAYSPGLWSRFDWVTVDGAVWYCQTAFDAPTEADALAVPAADSADPAASGCSGFAWTRMYAPLSVRGTYTDGWGSTHDVREWMWTTDDLVFHVVDYSDEDGWAIAQNGSDNAWNAGLWSRFEWARANDRLFYCQVAFDAETEATARAAQAADASDPENGGCGGFAWTELTPSP